MVFADLVRKGITLASKLTSDFQANVTHRAATSALNDYGKPVLAPVGVQRPAIVTTVDTVVRNQRGEEVVARTKVVFLSDVAVSYADEITLPNGRTAPILRVDHTVLPASGGNFVTLVYLE